MISAPSRSTDFNFLHSHYMKTRNLGVLPMNEQYKFIEIFESELCPCENCGRPISNIVELEKSDKKKVYVGTDCAKTLQAWDITNYWESIDKVKRFNNYKSNLSKARTAVQKNGARVLNVENMGVYVIWKFASDDRYCMNNITSSRAVYPEYVDRFKTFLLSL